jgi:hypothetical protein
MTAPEWKAQVEAATVEIVETGGQGVVVPGPRVLTVAHNIGRRGMRARKTRDEQVCVQHLMLTEGGVAQGTLWRELVRTKSSGNDGGYDLTVLAVDPVTDIAVLGPEDAGFATDAAAACAVTVRAGELVASTPVHVLTRKRGWIQAIVGPTGHLGKLSLRAAGAIEDGDSGGPVVDEAGHVVGLVSWSPDRPESDGYFHSEIPNARLALPVWVWRQLSGAQVD